EGATRKRNPRLAWPGEYARTTLRASVSACDHDLRTCDRLAYPMRPGSVSARPRVCCENGTTMQEWYKIHTQASESPPSSRKQNRYQPTRKAGTVTTTASDTTLE